MESPFPPTLPSQARSPTWSSSTGSPTHPEVRLVELGTGTPLPTSKQLWTGKQSQNIEIEKLIFKNIGNGTLELKQNVEMSHKHYSKMSEIIQRINIALTHDDSVYNATTETINETEGYKQPYPVINVPKRFYSMMNH